MYVDEAAFDAATQAMGDYPYFGLSNVKEFLQRYEEAKATSQSKESGWLLIETAPKDGTPILVTIAGGAFHASKVHWNEQWGTWAVTDSPKNTLGLAPTHWMPLPEPPTAAA